jgi:hypothetical protein
MNSSRVWIGTRHAKISFMNAGAVDTRVKRLNFLFGICESDVALFRRLVSALPCLELGTEALVLAFLVLELAQSQLRA